MKYLLLLLLGPVVAGAQVFKIPMDDIPGATLDKWLKATVGIEAEISYNKTIQNLRRFKSDDTAQMNLAQDLLEEYLNRRDRRIGTAIFLKHNDQHYLITAKHVLIDTTQTLPNQPSWIIFLISDSSILRDVPAVGDRRIMTEMDNLLNGVTHRDIATTDDIRDVGVLKIKNQPFIERLYNKGYVPITTDDFGSNIKIGDTAIIVGYPKEAIISNKIREGLTTSVTWQSHNVSAPVLSSGRVSLWDDPTDDTRFECSIFSYYGNSGGPIIVDNKLVGIVSGFYRLPYKRGQFTYIRYRSNFRKISLVLPLLKELESRHW